MVKNSVQHAISNYKGKEAVKDFPAVHPDGEYEEFEVEQEMTIETEERSDYFDDQF